MSDTEGDGAQQHDHTPHHTSIGPFVFIGLVLAVAVVSAAYLSTGIDIRIAMVLSFTTLFGGLWGIEYLRQWHSHE